MVQKQGDGAGQGGALRRPVEAGELLDALMKETGRSGDGSGKNKKKKPRAPRPHKVSRGEIVGGCALVMSALNKSKLPPASWYRVLGQCQRWVHSPDRMEK